MELAIALAGDPRLLLLDEPTAGMAPRERHQTIDLVARIAGDTRLTVLFTEHDMDVVFAVAARISVMDQGAVIAEGDPRRGPGKPGGPARLSRRGSRLTRLLEVRAIDTYYSDSDLGDRVYLLEKGSVVYEGTMTSRAHAAAGFLGCCAGC